MLNFVQALLRIAAGCAVLGIALAVAGFCLGGRVTSVRVYWDNGPRVRYEDAMAGVDFGESVPAAPKAPAAPSAPEAPAAPDAHHGESHEGGHGAGDGSVPSGSVRELEVDISAASVMIQTGDAFDLAVTGSPRYKSECSGSTWKIETEDSWKPQSWDNVSFVLTIPYGTVFDEVELNIGAGTMAVDGISCSEADIEVGAGTMTLKNFTCSGKSEFDVGVGTLAVNGGALNGRNEISCGMGTITMKLARPAQYGYAVDCAMGTVKIDGDNYSGMGANAEAGRGAQVFYDVDCGMGTIKIDFLD